MAMKNRFYSSHRVGRDGEPFRYDNDWTKYLGLVQDLTSTVLGIDFNEEQTEPYCCTEYIVTSSRPFFILV